MATTTTTWSRLRRVIRGWFINRQLRAAGVPAFNDFYGYQRTDR